MQKQVATRNNAPIKGSNLKLNQRFMTAISKNFEGTHFHLKLVGSLFFELLKC